MQIIEEPLPGCFLLKPSVIEDTRGYFFESFNFRTFSEATQITQPFVQDNQSFSRYGVVRGLHAQTGKYAQAKLVRVLKGEVLDVAVDMREGSATYGQHFSIRLSDENKLQLYIPKGFLHGFAVLSDTAEFFYKCDQYYHRDAEKGVYYADENLHIDWLIPSCDRILTEKDLNLPKFNER